MKVLLVTPDLQPPWNHGTKVYARGLLESIKKMENIEVTYANDIDSNNSAAYDFIHVVYAGSEQTNKVSERFGKTTIFKHIFTPAVNFRNAFTTKMYYSIVKSGKSNIVKCFSSEYVARSYFMEIDQAFVIPPAIDTQMFSNSKEISSDRAYKILENSSKSAWIENLHDIPDGLILYSGPLSEDRFPYKLVLNALKESKSKILILGRHTNFNQEVEAMSNIIEYAKRLGIESRVTVALKILDDQEKIDLMNFVDLIIQPFDSKIKYVAVDPPIFILESMACCKPVITSDTYSLASILQNGENGYVIDWNNPRKISEALNDCFGNKSKMGLKARKTILEKFSYDVVNAKLQRMYGSYGFR